MFVGPLLAMLAGAVGMAQGNSAQATPARPSSAATPAPVDLPILGLAGITFRSSNLDKARGYYQGVLGFQEAFSLKDASGATASIFFKVNDDQYVEVIPGLKPGELRRIARVTVLSSDLQKLHRIYTERGANPSPIRTGPDGNPVFRVAAPSDHNIDFIQYAPGSQQTLARGKFLSPDRISTHIWHVGLMTTDREAVNPFYQGKLGLGRQLPGGKGESIDTPAGDSNTETKFPRLDPNNPATREQWVRENDGAANHMAIEIADMKKARDLVQERGRYTDLQVRAHVGNNRHWLVHVFDPDGSRTEMMETAVQETLQPMTVMAPGRAVGPPIVPTEPRVIPWPAPGGRGGQGVISIQLEGPGHKKTLFRNLWLKNLQ